MLRIEQLVEFLLAKLASYGLYLIHLSDLLLFHGLDDGPETFRLRLPSLACLLELRGAHHFLLLLLLGLLHKVSLSWIDQIPAPCSSDAWPEN